MPVYSTREDMCIIPPLPDLGSTEPIEELMGDLDILKNRVPKHCLLNGVRVSFNDIMSLAGNFYGIEGSISDPGDETQYAKFERAYNDLALQDPDKIQSELDQLLAIMAIERNSVETVLGQGNPSIPTVLDETKKVPVKQLRSDVSGYNGYKLGYYNFAEDEKFGINVTNKLNERWACFGQKQFYDRFNISHREKVVKALQDVVAQIFSAFEDPNYRGDSGAILNQVPEPDTRMQNNYPLFRVSNDGRLLKRYYVNNLSSPSTTSYWWGGTTVDKVKSYVPCKSLVRLPSL
ncbi:hypothetical protein ACHWQZ_G012283 [Mnemiopsis leidyi]